MSTIGDVSTIPAGWYPDPKDGSRSRWWDGLSWTASVSDAQPAAPVTTTFIEPQQYVQQPLAPVVAAGSGLALTRRQLREQSEQLALAASTPQQADPGVIARSAHAAEPLPQAEPAQAEPAQAEPVIAAPISLESSAAHAEAAALIAAAIASPEPVSAPAAPFDWSPNAVMPAREEAPASAPEPEPVVPAVPAAESTPAPAPVVETAPEPVPTPLTVAVMSDPQPAPAEPLSNYAALAALFGSVENQNPEPNWEAEKSKAPAVVQFDYAASFAADPATSTPGYAPFGSATPAATAAPISRTALSPTTGAIWIMAISPIIQVAIGWVLFSYLAVDIDGPARYGFLGGIAALFVILAVIDRRSLRNNGYDKVPSVLWSLVPLFYFIARIVRTGARSVAPLLVWILSQAAVVAAVVLLMMPLIMALTAADTTTEPPAATVQPDSVILTEAQQAALLTPEGATEYARTSMASQGVLAEDLTCPAFPSTEVGATITCDFTADGEPMQYELVLQNVVVAP